jgi:hypothetical protein
MTRAANLRDTVYEAGMPNYRLLGRFKHLVTNVHEKFTIADLPHAVCSVYEASNTFGSQVHLSDQPHGLSRKPDTKLTGQ